MLNTVVIFSSTRSNNNKNFKIYNFHNGNTSLISSKKCEKNGLKMTFGQIEGSHGVN